MSSRGTVFAWVALAGGGLFAQSVVSVRSGVINFFEGSVLVDGQRLEPKFGKFYDVKQGSKLWTEDGRAEVLLTPGAILRVGEESSIRMISTALTDTRVEFNGGEIALDSRGAKTASAAPLHILYKGYEITLPKPGSYRLSSAPAELRVREGEAQVSANGKSVVVKEGHLLPFSGALVAHTVATDGDDSLDRWAAQRQQTLAATNATAAATDDMTTAMDTAPAAGSIFTDIPLYAPAPGSSLGGAYGPGYYGSPYWGGPGIYPFLYGVPRYGRYSGTAASPLWQHYPGSVITRTPAPWHPAPRVSMPSFRAPSAPHPATHAPAAHAIGHR